MSVIVCYFQNGDRGNSVRVHSSIFSHRYWIVAGFQDQPEWVNEINRVLSSTIAAEHVTTFGQCCRHSGECRSVSENGKAYFDHAGHTVTICPAEIPVGVECPLKSPSPEVYLQPIRLVTI